MSAATFTEIGAHQFNFAQVVEKVGSTDTVTECQCCGKKNLKAAIVLKDEDCNFTFVGKDCATRLLGKKKAQRVLKQKGSPVHFIEFSNGDKWTITVACGAIQQVWLGNVEKFCSALRLKVMESGENQEWLAYL